MIVIGIGIVLTGGIYVAINAFARGGGVRRQILVAGPSSLVASVIFVFFARRYTEKTYLQDEAPAPASA